MNNKKLQPSSHKSRNYFVTFLSGLFTLLFGFGAYVSWANLQQHDGFTWVGAITLTGSALLFLFATVSGKAEDFFFALISWR